MNPRNSRRRSPGRFAVAKQRRAQKGGERGPNGAFYEGGKFMATTDHPKGTSTAAKQASGLRLIAPGELMVPPQPGAIAIYPRIRHFIDHPLYVATGQVRIAKQFDDDHPAVKTHSSGLAELQDLAARFEAGVRWMTAAGENLAVPPELRPETRAPYDPDDMDAAVEYGKRIREMFAIGHHEEAYHLWRLDPNGGARADTTYTPLSQFVASMYSMRDEQANFLFEQPEGYECSGFTVGHEAHLRDSDQWAKIAHITEFNAKPYVELEFREVMSSWVDADGRRQVLKHLPGFNRHEGERASSKLLVAASEIDQTRPVAKDEDAFDLSEKQRTAVIAFRDTYGRYWKSKLRECWMKAEYPRGLPEDHAALLQQVRNQFGPEWLAKLPPDGLQEPATAEEESSEHRPARPSCRGG